jgi:hypothetical protein
MSIQTRKLKIMQYLSNTATTSLIKKEEVDFWDTLTDEEKADVEAGIAELDAGESIPYDVVMKQVRENLKQR